MTLQAEVTRVFCCLTTPQVCSRRNMAENDFDLVVFREDSDGDEQPEPSKPASPAGSVVDEDVVVQEEKVNSRGKKRKRPRDSESDSDSGDDAHF